MEARNRQPQAPDPTDFTELLRGRRSVNFFEPEPVGAEVLLEAIEVARWAPNHRLTEPWRFYVLGDETADARSPVARRNWIARPRAIAPHSSDTTG